MTLLVVSLISAILSWGEGGNWGGGRGEAGLIINFGCICDSVGVQSAVLSWEEKGKGGGGGAVLL